SSVQVNPRILNWGSLHIVYRENNLEKRYSIRPSQEIISQLKEKLTTYRQLSRGHSYTLEGIKENIKKLFVSLAPNV
ncbi:TPA: hypothetical protein ACT2F2_002028, partial [Streptococcus suis]